MFNVSDILRSSAARLPDKAALILDDRRVSFAELDSMSDRIAANLRAAGAGCGSAVAIMLPNSIEFVATYYGVLKAGATVVPLNPLSRRQEVVHFLLDSGATTLVAWAGVASEALAGAAEAGGVDVYVVGAPAGDSDGRMALSFASLLRESPPPGPPATSSDDTAVILYTSGTTGRPKGAELSHFNLFMNCHIVGLMFGVREDDVVLGALPFFHAFGQSSVMNIGIHFGCTTTVLPRFDASRALEVIERDHVTLCSAVPTMLLAMLAAPDLDRYDTSSLRTASSGGASLPADVLDRFEQRFGIPILEGYGLSETSPTATFNQSVDDRRVYSVGKPIWGVEVRVLGADDEVLPPGREHIGELVIRGHNVMKGYRGNPAATLEAFTDGWFRTGDLGYRDEDGFLFIVDRKKDLIIRGGLNVYPKEVEEVLHAHPAIASAAVIGVPDERLGEEILAAVSLAPGASVTSDELFAYCRERLAPYKCPRQVRFLDALPLGATGKVEKRVLKETIHVGG